MTTTTRQRVMNDRDVMQRCPSFPLFDDDNCTPPDATTAGSGNARKDGNGDDIVVIGALLLADADECDDRNVRDRRVGTSL